MTQQVAQYDQLSPQGLKTAPEECTLFCTATLWRFFYMLC